MTSFLFQVQKIMYGLSKIKSCLKLEILNRIKYKHFTVVKKIVSRMEQSIFDEF